MAPITFRATLDAAIYSLPPRNSITSPLSRMVQTMWLCPLGFPEAGHGALIFSQCARDIAGAARRSP
jgi:hypothetical protein